MAASTANAARAGCAALDIRETETLEGSVQGRPADGDVQMLFDYGDLQRHAPVEARHQSGDELAVDGHDLECLRLVNPFPAQLLHQTRGILVRVHDDTRSRFAGLVQA